MEADSNRMDRTNRIKKKVLSFFIPFILSIPVNFFL
jgi:hypothetical protein